MTKPSLRDTLIFIVILSLVVAAMFALAQAGARMGLIITLLVIVGLAAIFVWVADWACVGELLNRRLARGRAEYEKRREAEEDWR